jgi:phage shock protein A
MRDKVKAEAHANKMIVDLRALADECSKLRRQNRSLESKFKEAVRKGKGAAPQPIDRTLAEFDESDEEFETELLHFEKRFKILEEGPMGLDILASNLARDKRQLEKALKQSQEAHRATTAALEEWKALSNEKENTITELNQKVEDMMMAQAQLEEEIERKRREVEEAVNTERANLEARMKELEDEATEAKAQADSLVVQSDKLQQQLLKVHEQYDDAASRKQAEKAQLAAQMQGTDEPDAEQDEDDWDLVKEDERMIKKASNEKKDTVLKICIWQATSGNYQFRVTEGDGPETKITLSDDLVTQQQLLNDEGDWDFSRIGLSDSPDGEGAKVVISTFLGEKEFTYPGNIECAVLCRVYRYGPKRFYISGVKLETGYMEDAIWQVQGPEPDPNLSDEELVDLVFKSACDEGFGVNFPSN